MRIVRIQVYASQRYKAKDGLYDRRSMTLEAEVEHSDAGIEAIWNLQRQVDEQLEGWVNLHRFVEPEGPGAEATPVQPPSAQSSINDMPF